MPRIRELTFDSLKVKIAPLSWDEAEAYMKEAKSLLERIPPPAAEEWIARTVNTVVNALNKASAASANGNGNTITWDADKVKAEFDMVTTQEIHQEVMKMSGLFIITKAEATGEAPATSSLG